MLGGVAKVTGSIVGPMLFWAVLRVHRQLPARARPADGRCAIGGFTLIESTQVGQVTFMLVGLMLMLLMIFRPQGLFGNRKEMAFDGR